MITDRAMNWFCCVMAALVAVVLGILTNGETWPVSVGCAIMSGGFFERARNNG